MSEIRHKVTFMHEVDGKDEPLTVMYVYRIPQLNEIVVMLDSKIRYRVLEVLNIIDDRNIDFKKDYITMCEIEYFIKVSWK